jgi:hypothetical protein
LEYDKAVGGIAVFLQEREGEEGAHSLEGQFERFDDGANHRETGVGAQADV